MNVWRSPTKENVWSSYAKKKKKRHRWRAHSYRSLTNQHWPEIGFNRSNLISILMSASKGIDTQYLEIGCEHDDLFNVVPSRNKTGVDPKSGGTHRMTSDEFFAQNEECFDVIFVDGLHHYHQVRKDVINALKYLNTGGWIVTHDLLPRNKSEQHVPRQSPIWLGDCWKAAIELAHGQGIEFYIVYMDHGVGILRKTGKGNVNIPDMSGELESAGFDVYLKRYSTLPIISFREVVELIRMHSIGRCV